MVESRLSCPYAVTASVSALLAFLSTWMDGASECLSLGGTKVLFLLHHIRGSIAYHHTSELKRSIRNKKETEMGWGWGLGLKLGFNLFLWVSVKLCSWISAT